MSLRNVCRLRPGQTSLDCPPGTAGATRDGVDEGDLDPEVLTRGFETRYAWLEAHPDDHAGARAAQLRVLAPHLDQLTRAVRATEDSMCNRKNDDDDRDDDYDLDGGTISRGAQRRRDAALLGQLSTQRGATNDATPARIDDDGDTDEAAAAQRARNQWTAGRGR